MCCQNKLSMFGIDSTRVCNITGVREHHSSKISPYLLFDDNDGESCLHLAHTDPKFPTGVQLVGSGDCKHQSLWFIIFSC